MKLSQKSKRVLTVSFVVATLFGALFVAQNAVQILGGCQVADETHSQSIGVMSVRSYLHDGKGINELQPIVVVEGSATEPEILAKPVDVLLYSESKEFEQPDHWGFTAWKVQFYIRAILLLAMVVMLMWFAVNTLRSSRRGNIFTKCNLRLIYAMSPISFIYFVLTENIFFFKQLAIGDTYGERALVEFNDAFFEINVETIVVPMLLIVVAQLYNVAITMNEEEIMTV